MLATIFFASLFAFCSADDSMCSAGEGLDGNANALIQHKDSVKKLLEDVESLTSTDDAQLDLAGREEGVGRKAEGTVDALYTFGAPGTAKKALMNAAQANGCFPGARVVTAWNYWKGLVKFVQRDLVTWITITPILFDKFFHARTDVVELREWKPSDPLTIPCGSSNDDWPAAQAVVDTGTMLQMHGFRNFPGFYQTGVTNDKLGSAVVTAQKFAWAAYQSLTKAAQTVQSMNHSLLAFLSIPFNSGSSNAAFLAQGPQQECVLSFKGSDPPSVASLNIWLDNFRAAPTKFCGMTDVHLGFVNQLNNLITSSGWTDIKAKLPNCSSVSVMGHSKGGAVAEIFAACANSARAGDRDYERLKWEKGTPATMTAL